MLPSMRYETKKLTQLYHMKKSFKEHKRSIDKIKKKELNTSLDRWRDINQLRDRMHSAFNHTQNTRATLINKDNIWLYKKCVDDRKNNISIRINDKKLYNGQSMILTPREGSLNNSNQNIEGSKGNGTQQIDKSHGQQSKYILRNHRSSPINKMTNYQRSRENIRLAVKIAKPCAAINTKKLEQIHEQAKRHRQRIMRYDSVSLKSSKYLDKKLSSNSFRSHHVSSIQSKSKSKQKKEENPQIPKGEQRKRFEVKKLNKTSIFRNRYNDHLYGFHLTEYQG